MDTFFSFFSTSDPTTLAALSFIPLGIIFVVLLTLIVKSSITPGVPSIATTSLPVEGGVVPPSAASAVAATIAVGVPLSQPVINPVTAQSATPATSTATPTAPATPTSSVGTPPLPPVTPSPSPVPMTSSPMQTPFVATGPVPPVSSWKPVPQTTLPENMKVTESQMQAQATANEKVTDVEPAPRVEVKIQPPAPTMVDVISEPVVTPVPASSLAQQPVPPEVQPVPIPEQSPVPEHVENSIQNPPQEVTPTTPATPDTVVIATEGEQLAPEMPPATKEVIEIPVADVKEPEPLPTEPIKA